MNLSVVRETRREKKLFHSSHRPRQAVCRVHSNENNVKLTKCRRCATGSPALCLARLSHVPADAVDLRCDWHLFWLLREEIEAGRRWDGLSGRRTKYENISSCHVADCEVREERSFRFSRDTFMISKLLSLHHATDILNIFHLLTVSFLASPYSAFQLRCVHDDVWLSIISFRLRVDFFTDFNISLIGLNHRIGLHVWNWIFLHHGWNYHDGLRYDVGVSARFSWSKADVDLPGEVKCHKSLWRGGESMRGMED